FLRRVCGRLGAERAHIDHLKRQPVVDDLRLDGGTVEQAFHLDGAVAGVGGDATADESAEYRNGVLDRLFDAGRRPGDGPVDRADRALRVVAVVQLDVADVEADFHAFGRAHLVAGRLYGDVAVVLAEVLPQHRWSG